MKRVILLIITCFVLSYSIIPQGGYTNDLHIDVRTFGAYPNDGKDDTDEIQAALDYLEQLSETDITDKTPSTSSGGTLIFPDGVYVTNKSLKIKSRNIVLKGSGKRTGDIFTNIKTRKSGGAILEPNGLHSVILLNSKYSTNGFRMEDIGIVRDIALADDRVGVAVEWLIDSEGSFRRDFTFNRVAIVNFGKAFFLNRTDDANVRITEHSNLKIIDCFLHHNKQVLDYKNNGAWNLLTFHRNECGQNGQAGGIWEPHPEGAVFIPNNHDYNTLNIRGLGISIKNNILEACPSPITITNTHVDVPYVYSPVDIENNYFEHNYGRYLIKVKGVDGVHIGNNFLSNSGQHPEGLDDIVLLEDCMNGSSKMPTRKVGCMNINSSLAINVDKSRYQHGGEAAVFSSLDPEPLMVTAKPNEDGYYHHNFCPPVLRANLPFIGPSASKGLTVSGGTTFSEPGYLLNPVSEGTWIVFSMPILFTAQDIFKANLFVNGTLEEGHSFTFKTPQNVNEWYVLTVAKKITTTATSSMLNIQPYSTEPAAKTVKYLPPTVWTTTDVNQIKPWFNLRSAIFNSPPASGYWPEGTYINAHSSTGYSGYICVESNPLPGVWRGVGAVGPIVTAP